MPYITKLQHKQLLKKSEQLFSNLHKSLQKALGSATETQIHQLRVLVKRWRALLHMAFFCRGKKVKPKIYRRYLKMFARAGKLRDTQLHVALIKNSNLALNTQTYWQTLAGELKKAQRRFKKTCRILLSKNMKNQRKSFLHLIQNMNVEQITFYIQGNAQKALQLLTAAQQTDEQLHKLRKLLKRLLYNLQLLQQCGIELPNYQGVLPLITQFCEQLGRWQDKEVAITYLQKLNHNQHLFAPDEFNRLINYWNQEKNNLRQQLNPELSQLQYFLVNATCNLP
ncbi:MAG TPA: CHAD domain-containing protein [Chitinophagales bacterium]|nr:CHAD domain-containing protein [Chitinophagales bacterium]HRK27539.1 CHAD domain-containing protein [Chitinophagales bacterium]